MYAFSYEIYRKFLRSGCIVALRLAWLRSKLQLKREPVKLMFMASYFSGFFEIQRLLK